MFLYDPLICFLIGFGSQKGELRRGIFVIILFIILCVASFAVNPDWMFMFFLDANLVPIYIPLFIFMTYPIFFVLGYFAGLIVRSRSMFFLVVSAILSFMFLLFLFTWDRAFFGGSFEEFHHATHEREISFDYIASFLRTETGIFVLIGGGIFIIATSSVVAGDKKLRNFLLGRTNEHRR